MPDLQRKNIKFVAKGLDLSHPPDLLQDGFYPILNNVQATQQGSLTARPPVSIAVQAGSTNPILDIRRLNDPTTNTFTRVAVDGTNLLTGQTKLTVAATGFNGSRPSMNTLRPNQSPAPWTYVSDSTKSVKVNVAGTVYATGIVPPQTEPAVELGSPDYVIINEFNNLLGWSTQGTATGLTSVPRLTTTIANILFDNGYAGWACLNLALMDSSVQKGMLLTMNGHSTRVSQVLPAFANTSISSILYDSGPTGLCSITLITSPSIGLRRNALILLGSELVRVISTTHGVDNTLSFRCRTLSPHSAGEGVVSYPSVRVFTLEPHANGETVTSSSFQMSVNTGSGDMRQGTSLDLSTTYNRPLTIDDYVHVSIYMDNPANLVEGRISLDVDSTLNDFEHNSYYYPFRQSDFESNAQGTQTAIQTGTVAVQNSIIEGILATQPFTNKSGLTPTSSQSATGTGQWSEIKFKLASMVRVGSDTSRTLANVRNMRVYINVLGPTVVRASSWWIGGSFGPDVYQTSTPMLYGYRYRSTITGAVSNMSPAVRSGDSPERERMVISVVQSPDPQVDKIDICRFGGSVNSWRLASTVPNTTGSYNDDTTVTAIESGDLIEFDNYVPFPTTDLPHRGVCQVSGTSIQWLGGDQFNTKWVTGSLIVINNLAYTLSHSPGSTTYLQTIENVGSLPFASFYLPEPTLYGTPLPYCWDGGNQNSNVNFGCGDPLNPGYLYWSKPGAPDDASDVANTEVTSPTEILLGGFNYDGRAFCFSSERLFMINSATPLGTQTLNFTAQVIPTGKGIPLPFFYDVGTAVRFGSRDGIHSWSGGADESITDNSLYPLFPHKAIAGSTVYTYLPVDYSRPVALSHTNDSLYFSYADTGHTRRTMLYEYSRQGWFPYTFTVGVYCAYQEEGVVNSLLLGGADGNLYTYDKLSTELVSCQARSYCIDYGDSRAQKLHTDFMLDAEGATFALNVLFDNFAITLNKGYAGYTTRSQKYSNITTTGLDLHLNISLDLTWTGPGTIYEFQPSAYLQPFFAPVFITQATDHGFTTYGHLRDGHIALLSLVDVSVYVIVDGVEQLLFTVPSTGGRFSKYYSPAPPVKGKLILYRLSAPAPFLLFADETSFAVKEWGSDQPYTSFRPFAGVTNG